MEKKIPPSEIRYDDLVGVVSIQLGNKQSFNELAADLGGYELDRFEAVALRVFIKNSPIVTIYAVDKARSTRVIENGKLMVHKFRKEMGFEVLFSKLKQVNFTVTTGKIDIENMEVINK